MLLKEGAGKFKFVSTELTYGAQWGVDFVTLPLWISKTHSEGIDTFDTGAQCVQCLIKRLDLHLATVVFGICGSEKNLKGTSK